MNGWQNDSSNSVALHYGPIDPRAKEIVKHSFKGILRVTERAYLVIIDDTYGCWIPKSVCVDLNFYSNNSLEITMFDFSKINKVLINKGT